MLEGVGLEFHFILHQLEFMHVFDCIQFGLQDFGVSGIDTCFLLDQIFAEKGIILGKLVVVVLDPEFVSLLHFLLRDVVSIVGESHLRLLDLFVKNSQFTAFSHEIWFALWVECFSNCF